jgi:hypothetical protein
MVPPTFSRVEYHYRVRLDGPGRPTPAAWRDAFMAAFPTLESEARSVDQRSDRMAEVLGQIGSGLLLIGFSGALHWRPGRVQQRAGRPAGRPFASLATLRALGGARRTAGRLRAAAGVAAGGGWPVPRARCWAWGWPWPARSWQPAS